MDITAKLLVYLFRRSNHSSEFVDLLQQIRNRTRKKKLHVSPGRKRIHKSNPSSNLSPAYLHSISYMSFPFPVVRRKASVKTSTFCMTVNKSNSPLIFSISLFSMLRAILLVNL